MGSGLHLSTDATRSAARPARTAKTLSDDFGASSPWCEEAQRDRDRRSLPRWLDLHSWLRRYPAVPGPTGAPNELPLGVRELLGDQPLVATAGSEAERPRDEHEDAVLETHQIEEVDEQPRE